MSEASTRKMHRILSSRWTRRDDRGMSVPQQLTATGPSVPLPDVVRYLPQNGRGYLRGAEEPEDLEADDIVIAVMGPTGSGKSTFVSAASGRDIGAVKHSLGSFTDQVSAVKFRDQESGRHVILLDTPGFDDTSKSDLDILRLISDWLVSSYNNRKLLSGILYLHRITDNRVVGSPLRNLQVFQKLCGRNALDRVYLATTRWDEIELSVGERRLEELETEYWKTMISHGAQVARCRSDDDSAKQLIRQMIHSEYGIPPLRPHPVEIGQGPSSYLQETSQRYDTSQRGTPTQVEDRQGPSSHSQEKPQSYGGEPPPVQNVQEPSSYVQAEALRNGAIHGRSSAPQHSLEQVPSSHSQRDRQMYDIRHGGTPASQAQLVEYEPLHPQQRSQTYSVPRRGISTSQSPFDRQGPFPQTRNVEEPARAIEPSTVQRMHTSFNIVIFGEAGVGKSSVINLIAGEEVAETSPDSWGCTLESKQYTFKVARRTFNVWDTIGLGEPIFSVAGYLGAIEKTYSLIQQITAEGGLDLLLFCMPGSGSRISQTMQSNYRLFYEVLCEKRIPIALVVTHLEGETRMDDWWDRNVHYLNHCGLKFSGHACVTGLPGHERARECRGALEHLLLDYDHEGRYIMPSASEWNLGFLTRLASSLIPRQKGVKDKRKQLERILRDRCMMQTAVARRLAESLTRPNAMAQE